MWKNKGFCPKREKCPKSHPYEFKKDKPRTDVTQQGQANHRSGFNGNRSGRGRGGRFNSQKRNHTTYTNQVAPNQANHIDMVMVDENDFHVDAFGGQGFQQ